MNKKTFLILSSFAILGFFLRSYLLRQNLFFGPEQGRDFLVIRDIVIFHKFTLIGSPTDINGVFHGPLYYYLGTLPFSLSFGDPFWVALFFICIQSTAVFAVYFLAEELTGKRRVGIISAFLYTFSFGSVMYARWLCNPPLTMPLSALFFFCILRFIKGNPRYGIGAALLYGLLGQAEFINFILFGIAGLAILILYWRKITSYPLVVLSIILLTGLVFSFGTFLLFDLRHEFLIAKSVIALLAGKQGAILPLGESVVETYSVFMRSSMNILGLPNVFIALCIVLSIIFALAFSMREKREYAILFAWIILPNAVLIVLRHGAMEQYFMFLPVALCISCAIGIHMVMQKIGIAAGALLVILFFISNMYCITAFFPDNRRVFYQETQPNLRYSDEQAVVDYVYDAVNGRQFYFQSYTIPYFWQDAWSYLFWQKGTTKHLILPDQKHDDLLYVIIQKDRSNPRFQYDWYINTVTTWGALTRTKEFGELTVEERVKQ